MISKPILFLAAAGWFALPLCSAGAQFNKYAIPVFDRVEGVVRMKSIFSCEARAVANHDGYLNMAMVETAPQSYASLHFPDGSQVRAEGGTAFSVAAHDDAVILRQGAVIFHSAPEKRHGTLKTELSRIELEPGTVLLSGSWGGVDRIAVWRGRATVRLSESDPRTLRPGELLLVRRGQTDLGTPMQVDLEVLQSLMRLRGSLRDWMTSL